MGHALGNVEGVYPVKRSLFALLVGAALWAAGSAVWAEVPPEPGGSATPTSPEPEKINSGDTAWMLMSTGLVMLMVPGLALFYGGMVRRKNVLGTMMHSMVALAIIGIQWVLFGYALAFGDTHGGWIGWSSSFLGLQGVALRRRLPRHPHPHLRPLHVSGHVRHHHAGAHQRRHWPSASSSGRTACSSSCGPRWYTIRWPIGSGR